VKGVERSRIALLRVQSFELRPDASGEDAERREHARAVERLCVEHGEQGTWPRHGVPDRHLGVAVDAEADEQLVVGEQPGHAVDVDAHALVGDVRARRPRDVVRQVAELSVRPHCEGLDAARSVVEAPEQCVPRARGLGRLSHELAEERTVVPRDAGGVVDAVEPHRPLLRDRRRTRMSGR